MNRYKPHVAILTLAAIALIAAFVMSQSRDAQAQAPASAPARTVVAFQVMEDSQQVWRLWSDGTVDRGTADMDGTIGWYTFRTR